MFSRMKVPSDTFQKLLTTVSQRGLSIITASRLVALLLVVSLILPLPWFRLQDTQEATAGTRVLSYVFDNVSASYMFANAPLHTLIFFSLPFAVTALSFAILVATFVADDRSVRNFSALNVAALVAMGLAAAKTVEPAQHIIVTLLTDFSIVLPKWGMWLTFLTAVGLLLMSGSRLNERITDWVLELLRDSRPGN